MEKPLAFDLCCGLGGWTRGLLSTGWDVIGFDVERHKHSELGAYPAQLVLQDIRTVAGSRKVSLVVASPPCQRYSFMAMPFTIAKQRREECLKSEELRIELNSLVNHCFRIARECGCPIVLENVKGAQEWIGRSKAKYGSFHLWGDIGMANGRIVAITRRGFAPPFIVPREVGIKIGGGWFKGATTGTSKFNSKDPRRKELVAEISMIPSELAEYVGRSFHP